MDAGVGRSQVHPAPVGWTQHFDSEAEQGLGHPSVWQQTQPAPWWRFGLAEGYYSSDSGCSAEMQASVCRTEVVAERHKKPAGKSAEAPLCQTAALFAVLVLLLSFSSPDLL